MIKTQQDKSPSDLERHTREAFSALIREQVLHSTGTPGDLLSVRVHPLWDNHYRVNIFSGADITSARVARSYFLVTDADGNVVASTPPIKKRAERTVRTSS